MDIVKQEHGQLFHHEEAHQQKPNAMNFGLNCVTMATLPDQNNNKSQFHTNGRNSSTMLPKHYQVHRMIAIINCYQLQMWKPILAKLYSPRR